MRQTWKRDQREGSCSSSSSSKEGARGGLGGGMPPGGEPLGDWGSSKAQPAVTAPAHTISATRGPPPRPDPQEAPKDPPEASQAGKHDKQEQGKRKLKNHKRWQSRKKNKAPKDLHEPQPSTGRTLNEKRAERRKKAKEAREGTSL